MVQDLLAFTLMGEGENLSVTEVMRLIDSLLRGSARITLYLPDFLASHIRPLHLKFISQSGK